MYLDPTIRPFGENGTNAYYRKQRQLSGQQRVLSDGISAGSGGYKQNVSVLFSPYKKSYQASLPRQRRSYR